MRLGSAVRINWALAFLAAFGLAFWVPFLYDDKLRILESAAVQGAWPGWKFWLGFVYGDGEYEPLVFIVHWVLRRFSDGVFPLRLTSMLLHAANAFLAWRLLRRVLGDERRAFWAAVLFSLFPAHVETIALSTFKKHLLVAFFGLAMLNVQGERRLGPGFRAAAALGLLVAALLSRESALILPWLSLLTAWGVGGKEEIRRNAPLHAGLFAAAGLYGLGRVIYLPHAPAALAGENWFWHSATSGKIFLWDLRQLALPLWLGLEHSLRPVSTGRELLFIGSACLGIGIFLKNFLGTEPKTAGKGSSFGLAWMALALLPSLNLFPFTNFSLVADRYLYLPSLGFFAFVSSVARGHRALILPAAAFVGLSITHMARFTDPLELWAHAAMRAPDNPRALGAWGAALLEKGRLEEAEGALRRAVELDPGYPEPALDLARALAESGKLDEAVEAAEAQARRRPTARALNNLGIIQMRAGRPGPARSALESAWALSPGDPEIAVNLGACWLKLGIRERGEALLEKAAADPRARAAARQLLAESALARGQKVKALDYFIEVLKDDPLRWEAVRAAARLEFEAGRAASARERLARYRAMLESNPPPRGAPPRMAEAWRKILEEAGAEAARY